MIVRIGLVEFERHVSPKLSGGFSQSCYTGGSSNEDRIFLQEHIRYG